MNHTGCKEGHKLNGDGDDDDMVMICKKVRGESMAVS